MSEWVTIQLKELLTLKRGYDLPHSETKSGPYPVVASTNVRGYHNEYKVDGPVITVGRSGSIGHVQYIESKAWPLNTTLYMTDAKGNNKRFIYYFLKTIGLEQFNSGAGVPTLNRNHINLLKVKIPTNTIQTKIADVLSTYDKLIENNNRRIRILEQTAEELYKEWFVRMRFPGYENTKFDKGIPEGWEVKKLKDFAILSYGKQLPTTELTDKGYEVFGGNGVIGYYSEYMYKEQKILISCRGAASGEIVVSNPYSYITNNSLILDIQENLFEYMKQNLFYRNLKPYATGSAQPQITIRNIENLKFLIPLSNTLENFNDTNRKISNKILYLKKKNKNLVKQRDLLLPRLMNGTIIVK